MDQARFLSHLQTTGGFLACWPFTPTRPNGYAVYGGGNAFGTGELYTHRIVYRLIKGAIPEGYDVDHVCRTTNCVNPMHLEAVTRSENNRRREHPTTMATQCPKGHPYAGENLYKNPKTGRRHCRECMRIANRRLRREKSRQL